MPDLSTEDLKKEVEARRLARAEKRKPIEAKIERNRLECELACDDAANAAGLIMGIDCKIVFADNTGHGILIKRPAQTQFQLYTQKVLADKCGPTDRYAFAKGCLVYPDQSTFNTYLDETPGLILKACEVAGNLASAEEAEVEGK